MAFLFLRLARIAWVHTTFSSREVVLDRRHQEVITGVDNRSHDFEPEVASAGRNRLGGDLAVDLLDGSAEARGVLVAGHVGVVDSALAAGDHIDLDVLVSTEPVHQFLEGLAALLDDNLVVVGEALGKAGRGAHHDGIVFLRFVLDDIVRLTEHDGGKGKVDEAVLELGGIIDALRVLVDLVADNTSDHGRGRSDGWNNLTGNHLSLVAVTLSDLVVTGS